MVKAAGIFTVPGVAGDAVVFGARTAKARLFAFTAQNGAGFRVNANSAGTIDESTSPAWTAQFDGSDAFSIYRSPAGTTAAFANLLRLDPTGTLTLPGDATAGQAVLGSRTAKARLMSQAGSDLIAVTANNAWSGSAWMEDDASKAGWYLSLQPTTDKFTVSRTAPSNGTGANLLSVFANGDLTIVGGVAAKATGTAWVAASDPRLKRDMVPYTTGLDAIVQLAPITFKFNGRGGTPDDDRQCWGFDASAVQAIMPECVGTRPAKLDPADETETEILTLDVSNILLALRHASMAACVAALEGTA